MVETVEGLSPKMPRARHRYQTGHEITWIPWMRRVARTEGLDPTRLTPQQYERLLKAYCKYFNIPIERFYMDDPTYTE